MLPVLRSPLKPCAKNGRRRKNQGECACYDMIHFDKITGYTWWLLLCDQIIISCIIAYSLLRTPYSFCLSHLSRRSTECEVGKALKSQSNTEKKIPFVATEETKASLWEKQSTQRSSFTPTHGGVALSNNPGWNPGDKALPTSQPRTCRGVDLLNHKH